MNIKIQDEIEPYLYTKRLILRNFSFNDLDELFLLYNDQEVNQFLPWFIHETKEVTKKYFEDKILNEISKGESYYYVIEDKLSKKVIGYFSINNIDFQNMGANLGYGIFKKYWNKGIVSEVGLEIIRYLQTLGFNYLTATHDVNNVGSGKVLQKIGMKYCYSYEEKWQPKNLDVIFRMYQIYLDGNNKRVYMEY